MMNTKMLILGLCLICSNSYAVLTEAEINEENIRYLEEQQRKQEAANRQRDQDDNLKNAAGNLLNSLI